MDDHFWAQASASKTVLAEVTHAPGPSTSKSRSHSDLSAASKPKRHSLIPILQSRRSSRSSTAETLSRSTSEAVDNKTHKRKQNHSYTAPSSRRDSPEPGSSKGGSKHQLKSSKVGENFKSSRMIYIALFCNFCNLISFVLLKYRKLYHNNKNIT